ncbi:MFS transporter, ACS family, hexuronate transporter [Sphingomonas laterariae]|uniref:MFS transporter, ACS family, hexuronate transporter n=1 Tax=Edaphosphingomonas laterariae TaxID=861865 RepID=A0A239CC78_9SPHN|nr:MFS transporter [Sphingomonas laterariae]SNS16953.1 MFS transporter, ACS family, hexuronate transporter [Sphingomonas laterariae]
MTLSPRRRTILFTLVLTATILNLVDRQIIAVLKPVIAADLGWTDNDYGTLAAWFQGAAAFALLFTGWIVDRLGVKWANPLGVITWSVAAIAHGWARTMGQFILCRAALGATEAMGTPAAIKTIATIFPPEKRSFGFGMSNAIGSIGAILTPLVIPVVAMWWGWRAAFLVGGGLGLIWGAAWLLATRGVDFGDRGAESTRAAPLAGIGAVLKHRRTWAIAIAKVLSDATWWLLLFWMPDFFNRMFGLSGLELGPPLAVAYGCGAVGAFFAGWIATRLIAAGRSVNAVRKGSMLVAALLVTPVPLALGVTDYWSAVALLGLAIGAHQAFSTNLFALIADVTPGAEVGRVTSFGAFCGNLGGMAIVKVAGLLLTWGLGYTPLFLFAAISYLLAVGVIQLMIPRIERGEEMGGPAWAPGH